MDKLTSAGLKELVDYNPETGVFTWRSDRSGRVKAGSVAGSVYSNGYVMIGIDYRYRGAHRLAWLYVHGEWPVGVIDHINGIRSDNRIANLRDVTQAINNQNQRPRPKKRLMGAVWDRANQRWKAQIGKDRKMIYLGQFDTPEQAHAAYLEAKRRLHEGCTI